MKQFSIYPPVNKKAPKPGQILIAEPLLNDPNFTRSVVLLCDHSEEGSMGFVLNQPTKMHLGDLINSTYGPGPLVYKGGPVQPDSMHMLHTGQFEGGQIIAKGIYWGCSETSMSELSTAISSSDESNLRLFAGYSGWGPGQLEKEIKEGTWLLTDATAELLFTTDVAAFWKTAISALGNRYRYLAHMPTDPQMN